MGSSQPRIPRNPPMDDEEEEEDPAFAFKCEICSKLISYSEKRFRFRNDNDCARSLCANCIFKHIRTTGKIKCPVSGCDSLLKCEICSKLISYSENRFRLRNDNDCAHSLCTNCIFKHIRTTLEDYNTGKIKCPVSGCNRLLDPLACAEVAGNSLFVRWCDELCEAAIVGLDGCYCPYRDCNVRIVNECGGSVGKASCPSCKRWFCFRCKGFRCVKSGESSDLNDVDCWRLVEEEEWIELMHGCNIATCRCGNNFCWKCGKEESSDTTSLPVPKAVP